MIARLNKKGKIVEIIKKGNLGNNLGAAGSLKDDFYEIIQ
jgi:hypothetical protein